MNSNAFTVDRETPLESCAIKIGASMRDYPSPNGFGDYLRLADELTDTARYRVLRGKDFYDAPADPGKVTLFLRHDIDFDPLTALRMAHAEAERNLHSTFYVLPTAGYYGAFREGTCYRYACMDWVYQAIAALGHEIGVHNDLLTLMLEYDIDPAAFQMQELEYYRSIGLDVCGVCSHGSPFNPLGLNNTWMYSEFGKKGSYLYGGRNYSYGELTLEQFGFRYGAYLMTRSMPREYRMIDIEADRGTQLLTRLKALPVGIKCMMTTHPIWWKNEKGYLK